MKKSLIALAVAAGSIAAAQADTTTLYGSLGYSSVISRTDVDNKVLGDAFKGLKDNHWGIETTTAKLGVKGTEDLDNGLQAFYKFEFGAGEPQVANTVVLDEDGNPAKDANGNIITKETKFNDGLSKVNYAYIGLKGDFGTVTIGRQKSLFKTVTDTGLFEDVGISKGDAPGVVSKAVSYVSPASAGVQFGAAVVADNKDYSSLGADAWEIAAMYKQNGFDAGLVYSRVLDGEAYAENGKVKVRSNGSTEYTGLNIGYGNEQFDVVGRVRHASSEYTDYGVEGQYKSGPNTFRAGIGVYDPSAKGVKNTYTYALGYKYNFSERTYTWVEGQFDDNPTGNKDGFRALVGIRHDF